MESNPHTINATESNISIQHIHKLDWMATSLLVVLIIVVSAAGYNFGRAADADLDKSRNVAVLRNHVDDLQQEMKTIQTYEAFHQFLEERKSK